MSPTYIHCPVCGRAFDVASTPACPHCRRSISGGPARGAAGPARARLEQQVREAAERMARALAGAGRDEVEALAASLARSGFRAADAATAPPARGDVGGWRRAVLGAVARAVRDDRAALLVPPPVAPVEQGADTPAASTLLWALLFAALSRVRDRALQPRSRASRRRRVLRRLWRAVT